MAVGGDFGGLIVIYIMREERWHVEFLHHKRTIERRLGLAQWVALGDDEWRRLSQRYWDCTIAFQKTEDGAARRRGVGNV